MKRQPTEGEKMFAKDMTDKSLIANIYKQLIQPNVKKQNKTKKNLDFKIGRREFPSWCKGNESY